MRAHEANPIAALLAELDEPLGSSRGEVVDDGGVGIEGDGDLIAEQAGGELVILDAVPPEVLVERITAEQRGGC